MIGISFKSITLDLYPPHLSPSPNSLNLRQKLNVFKKPIKQLGRKDN